MPSGCRPGIEVVVLSGRIRTSHDRAATRGKSKSHALILADESTCAWTLQGLRKSPRFLKTLGVPIIALDVWNVGRRRTPWDLLNDVEPIRPLEDVIRLQPVPFLRPVAQTGAYNALPALRPMSQRARREARTALGLSHRDRLIVMASSPWQAAGAGGSVAAQRLAIRVPVLLAGLLGRVGDRIAVLHIGPRRYSPLGSILGRRYSWRRPVAPHAFEQSLRAADLFLSLNVSSTSTMSAVCMGVPILSGVNSHRLESRSQLRAVLGSAASPFLERWLQIALPLFPFAVWPKGLHAVMSSALARNPYRPLLHVTEVIDERRFVARARSLLYDDARRGAATQAGFDYRERVSRLPHAADLILDATS